MRSDMKKVVTERPRSGGGVKTPKGDKRVWQECAAEDYPQREKIRVKWVSQYGGKNFTDLLGPLYRYLLRQVGRKWDAVYSEICAHLPKTSMQNRHIFTHLWEFVERHVKIVDGVACYIYHRRFDLRRAGQEIVSRGRYAQLYIHPGNGLLCKAKKWKSYKYRNREKPAPPAPGIKVYPGVQYHKLDGVWYEVKVEKYRPVDLSLGFALPHAGSIQDAVLNRTYKDMAELSQVYGGRYLAVSKRPLNGRELKFAGLK